MGYDMDLEKISIDDYGSILKGTHLIPSWKVLKENLETNLETIKKLGIIKSLLSIISNQTFQEYWNISKGKIEVCRDCEFRYVCNDGRIPLKRDEKMYYFEESCTYDPYKTN